MTYYLFNGNNNSPGVSCLILNIIGTRMAIIGLFSQSPRNLIYTLYQGLSIPTSKYRVLDYIASHRKANFVKACEDKRNRQWFMFSGAHWLSGRVLDSRSRGRGFEPHRRHRVVVHEQDTFILAEYWFNPGKPVPV